MLEGLKPPRIDPSLDNSTQPPFLLPRFDSETGICAGVHLVLYLVKETPGFMLILGGSNRVLGGLDFGRQMARF